MKKLSVIITHYREDETTCLACLNTLDMQVDCNWDDYEIIVVNDCSDRELPDSFFEQFKNLKVQRLRTPVNGGPGVARQLGIDRSTGEYIFFIDIDDILVGNRVFNFFETEVYPNQKNINTTTWIQDIQSTQGRIEHHKRKQEFIWIFAKFYKRSFLTANNISFHPELRLHEDVYFHRLCLLYCDKANILHFDFITYQYLLAPNSLTRSHDNYSIRTFALALRSLDLTFDRALLINHNRLSEMITDEIVSWYYVTHKPKWFRTKFENNKKQTDDMISYMLNKWGNYINSDLLPQLHKKHLRRNFYKPRISFEEWLNEAQQRGIHVLPEYQ